MIDTGFERKQGSERLCVWSQRGEQRQQNKTDIFLRVYVLPSIIILRKSCWNGYSQPVALWECDMHLASTGSSELLLVALCPPKGSPWQVRFIVGSH